MLRQHLNHWVFVAAVAAVGCEASVETADMGASTGEATDGSAATTAAAATSAASNSTTAATTTTTSPGTTVTVTTVGEQSDSSGGPTEGSSGASFLTFEDHPIEPPGCDLFAQDCPEGLKCMPWANDDGNTWNALKCTPIVPDPDGIDEACVVEGSPVSGVDSCELGAMCWDVDPGTLAGECIPFCVGDEGTPTCEDENRMCSISASGPLALCIASCNPLMSDCDEDEGCYPANDAFVCASDASGEGGAYLEECAFINACDSGLACLAGTVIPGCEADGCCTPYCSVATPSCPDLLDCVPFYAEGTAPDGAEDLGFCGAAQ